MNGAVIDNRLIYQQETRRHVGWALAVTVAVHALVVLWLLIYSAPAVKPVAQARPMDFNLTVQAPAPAVKHASVVPKPQVVQRSIPEPVPEPALTPDPVVEPAPVAESTPVPVETPSVTPSPTMTPAPVEEPAPALSKLDYVYTPEPQYPARAKRLGQRGRVVIHLVVLPDGSVGEASIKETSGYKILDDAALDAVRGWKFTPLSPSARQINRYGDKPIEFTN